MDNWIAAFIFIVKTAQHYSLKLSFHKSQSLNKTFQWFILIQQTLYWTQNQQRILSGNNSKNGTDLPTFSKFYSFALLPN